LRAVDALRELGALVFPTTCQVCKRLGEPPICEACAAAFEAITAPLCVECGRPFDPQSRPAPVCADCARGRTPLASARSFGLHVGTLREAVNALKFEGRTRVAAPLAQRLACLLDAEAPVGLPLTGKLTAIVPVPLHPTRRRDRGFDQAELLGEALAELTGIAVRRGALLRTRATPPQVGLSPAERRENVRGAFALRHPLPPSGVRVLLVDDVCTTGSTLHECARTLLRGGVEAVHALTVTRAAPEWHPQADLLDRP
jgi:ComF family protein